MRELAARVAEARAKTARSHDPLLDLRSANAHAVSALVRRGAARLGLPWVIGDEGEGEAALSPESLEQTREALRGIGGDLDERLEETVTEIAEHLGIVVDLE
ncbi:MAG: hypothetical protein ACOCVR_01410, partial [Myxococcota bacterium]